MTPRVRFLRLLALGGYLGLLARAMAWPTLLAPPERVPVVVALVLMSGPLLFPLRGMLHGRVYTHAWASMLALAYVAHAIVELWANPGRRWLAGAELLFSVAFFFGAMFYTRYRARELREQP